VSDFANNIMQPGDTDNKGYGLEFSIKKGAEKTSEVRGSAAITWITGHRVIYARTPAMLASKDQPRSIELLIMLARIDGCRLS
jgi:hypothetical protein